MEKSKVSRYWMLCQLRRSTDERSRQPVSYEAEHMDRMAKLAGENQLADLAREARRAADALDQAVQIAKEINDMVERELASKIKVNR